MKQQAEMKKKFGSSNHRLGLNDKVPLLHGFDYLYKGSMYIGESDQEMKVIYDTGSDWLLIEGRGCESCAGALYDSNTSSYFSVTNVRVYEKEYGSFVHVKGKQVQD